MSEKIRAITQNLTPAFWKAHSRKRQAGYASAWMLALRGAIFIGAVFLIVFGMDVKSSFDARIHIAEFANPPAFKTVLINDFPPYEIEYVILIKTVWQYLKGFNLARVDHVIFASGCGEDIRERIAFSDTIKRIFYPYVNFTGGGRAKILEFYDQVPPYDRYFAHRDISSQLPISSFPRVIYQTTGRAKQSNSCQKEKEGKHNEKGISDLKSISVERRPELGSLLSSLGALGLGVIAGVIGMESWGNLKRVQVSVLVVFCFMVGMSGTLGILIGLDPLSLWNLLW